jgi:hypothetical protein
MLLLKALEIKMLVAWLKNYRRSLVRYDRLLENYLAFVLQYFLSDPVFKMSST